MAGKSSTGERRAQLIQALSIGMRRASAQGVLFGQAVAQRLGLNPSDMECMDLVVMSNGVTAGQLAEATGLTTGAITGVIDRLEDAGYVVRERDAEDRRKVYVRAVPAKVRKAETYYEPMQQAFMATMQNYTDEQLELLADFIRRGHEMMVDQTTKLLETSTTRSTRGSKGGK